MLSRILILLKLQVCQTLSLKFFEIIQILSVINWKFTLLEKNAQVFLQIQKEYGSFSDFLWGFVNFKPIKNSWKYSSDVPTATPISEKISKDLKRKGMKFVGPTIIYAYMQATGLVNDHLVDCWRHLS